MEVLKYFRIEKKTPIKKTVKTKIIVYFLQFWDRLKDNTRDLKWIIKYFNILTSIITVLLTYQYLIYGEEISVFQYFVNIIYPIIAIFTIAFYTILIVYTILDSLFNIKRKKKKKKLFKKIYEKKMFNESFSINNFMFINYVFIKDKINNIRIKLKCVGLYFKNKRNLELWTLIEDDIKCISIDYMKANNCDFNNDSKKLRYISFDYNNFHFILYGIISSGDFQIITDKFNNVI